MKNIELLAPAGDQESLIAAIQNGANAIYLGGTLFNARAFAKNFDNDQLKWAVQYAHGRDVKIFVTVNTLFNDDEFEDLIAYLDYLYSIQVDALIIQDIGLFHIVKERYKDFEIHMSTQATCMNKDAVAYYEKHGASRVVLARENTLEEIREITQSTSLDIEVFVHGAICVCYSGQCLMSSFIGKRSGNKGACAQPCRLTYDLYENNRLLPQKIPYLLSVKDLMTIEHIGDLIDAGVTSFKIEGRMKRPEYVASVVKAYRCAIDAHLNKKRYNIDQDLYYMKSMFNRDYTKGYIFHDNDLLKGDYSGNKGVIIGNVKSYSYKNKRVLVELSDELVQGDSIVFEDIDKGRPVNKMYLNHKLISHADKGTLIEIEFDYPVKKGVVRKTINTKVVKELQNTYIKENVNLPIQMYFTCFLNQHAYLKVTYKDFTSEIKSTCISEQAINRPLDQDRILQQLSKLGQTPFQLNKIKFNIDNNISLPIKEINEMRRTVIEDLFIQMQERKIHHYDINRDLPLLNKNTINKRKQMVLVSSLSQLKIACLYDNIDIAYPYSKDCLEAYQYLKSQNKEMILYSLRIMKQELIEEIKQSVVYGLVNKVIVNDIGSYFAFDDKECILGTGMNLYNSYSLSSFDEDCIVSLEMTKNQYMNLNTNLNKTYVQVFGKIENMVSEYCPISQYYFGYQKKNCHLCKKNRYSLKDRKGEFFDLMMDDYCKMHLLNCRTLFIDQYKDKNIFIYFTNESNNEVKDVLDYYLLGSKICYKDKFNVTNGYFK